MNALEADLEAWLAMHERRYSPNEIINALQGMIDRIEEEYAGDAAELPESGDI